LNQLFLSRSVRPATMSRYDGHIKEKFLRLGLTLPAGPSELTTFGRHLCAEGLLAGTVKNYIGAVKTLGEISYGRYFSSKRPSV
jgi:hypothetical protein